jgi:DNA polymerase elongation subunit (family B)
MTSTQAPLCFQILGATGKDLKTDYHIETEETSEYADKKTYTKTTKLLDYTITLFGTTERGESVSLLVTGFRPYFYVEIPEEWKPTDISAYKRSLLRCVTSVLTEGDESRISMTIEHHKSFWDFTNNRISTFLKIQVPSIRLWRSFRDVCQHKETAIPIPVSVSSNGKQWILRTFEANIDPLLRFFHLREVKPAGWIYVDADMWEETDIVATTTKLQATAEWDQVSSAPADIQLKVAPLRILSWDIECTSSHGDFPLATKTWRKPSREIVEKNMVLWPAVKTALQRATISSDGPLSRVYLSEKGIRIFEKGLDTLSNEWAKAEHAIRHKTADVIDIIDTLLTTYLPELEGDPIIQIGSVLYVNGKPQRKDIFVLGTCTKLQNTEQDYAVHTHAVATEATLLRNWCALLKELDPDILVGYNIFGFDEKYLWDRAETLGCEKALSVFGRTMGTLKIQEKFLSSSAMGDNTFYFIPAEGRLHIDLLAYVRRNATLESYSLDNVTATFMSGSITGRIAHDTEKDLWTIPTKSTKGTIAGRYIVLMDEDNEGIGEKYEVIEVQPKSLLVRMPDRGQALCEHGVPPVRWSQSKDNVSPKDIFALHGKGADERAIVAKYCIQDCDLVMELFQKLEVLHNSIAMANVCWVPVEYIFTRGQGIKAESLVFYECYKEGQRIPVLPNPRQYGEDKILDGLETPELLSEGDEKYEGAIVLEPRTGIYLEDEPVAALDFSSLYPSTIISENLSHDSLVWVKDYDLSGNLLSLKEGSDTYDNVPGIDYVEVDYDILKPKKDDTRKHPPIFPVGKRICRYAQLPNGVKATIPKILQKLLSARKATRKQAEKETDIFRKTLLDAQQLAYKLTANSLYGQLGSNTSKIRRKCLAASTTAHGRQQLLFSKACIEEVYGSPNGVRADPRCDAICVYGDTDSVFISFRPMNPLTGQGLTGRKAQEAAKALAEEAGKRISGALKPPHDFEFDKMFRCFCLLSKKRYVGDMTEGGLENSDYYRKSMGIVMKRRDNAPIVKYIYGGMLEHILVRQDIPGAFSFVQSAAHDLLQGKFSLKHLTITKSLRAEYKLVPAHKILADRIAARDPGNKPCSNDRIPYIYVAPPKGKKAPSLQGDRIESPSYIREKKLTPDYAFYITNQIAKPISQVFGLIAENLPGVGIRDIEILKRAKDPVTAREALAYKLLFDELLQEAEKKTSGQTDMRSFFKCKT